MSLTNLTILAWQVVVDGVTRLNLCAVINGTEVVGSCFVENWDREGGCISFVFVPEQHRRQGIARRLVQECIRRAEEAGKRALALGVATGNHAALTLYESLGFRGGFTYADGTLMMHCVIPSSDGRE